MTKANDTEIYSILPYSIRNDQKVKDLCSTLDKVLMPLAEEAKMALVYSRIDVLPEDIIDLLAWQLHVDTYDTAAEISIKREQVRQSISLHKKRGTPYAVRSAIEIVFSKSVLQEWFLYEGRPYYFKVLLEIAPKTKEIYTELLRTISAAQNVRSWLEKIEAKADHQETLYVGMARRVNFTMPIYPVTLNQDTNPTNNTRNAMVMTITETINLKEE
ncbi:phage tail protein I [Acidaminococcus massiliensis]|jgi:phage tail P2-like protein|uniref:phage tail protein I n=1 Tax=Acidaminococcus massiliensis TaxID=1852375 RepID=UPI00266D6E13|nr:phage tail protein I [Acidaminococcus massiliensis]